MIANLSNFVQLIRDYRCLLQKFRTSEDVSTKNSLLDKDCNRKFKVLEQNNFGKKTEGTFIWASCHKKVRSWVCPNLSLILYTVNNTLSRNLLWCRVRELRDAPSSGRSHQSHEWLSDLKQKTQSSTQEDQIHSWKSLLCQQWRQTILACYTVLKHPTRINFSNPPPSLL